MTDLPRENVQSYPRPPVLEPVAHRLRIMLGGVLIADTVGALRVLETHHAPTYYLPPSDIIAELRPAEGSSMCEWKGRAHYFDIVAGGAIARRAAWSYAQPTERFARLKDHLAFYPALMEACYVGEERATAQPGRFYGGWVTSNLDGTVKGAPGTQFW